MIIRMKHARSVWSRNGRGYCSHGIRQFCEKHSIDYPNFLKNGMPEEEVLALNDCMANKIVEHARRMELDGK